MITLFRILKREYRKNFFSYKNKFSKKNFFISGRQALNFILNDKINFNFDIDEVYLPSYCPEGLIDPIRKSKKVKYKFYKLDKNLLPDSSSIKKININNNKKKLFILIHYFGYNSVSKKIKDLLNKKNFLIVHDLAQSFFLKKSYIKIKDDDIFLYSLNKYFPVSDGAYITTNKSLIINFDNKKNNRFNSAINFYLDHLKANSFLKRENDRKKNKLLTIKSSATYEKYYKIMKNDLKPSNITKRSLNIFNKINFKIFKDKRLFNSRKIVKAINKNTYLRKHNKNFLQINNIVPWCVPILVSNRNKMIKYFMKKNILLSTLEDKWNFIPNKKEFKYENFFIKNHVLIPNNEFLSKKDLKKITKELVIYNG